MTPQPILATRPGHAVLHKARQSQARQVCLITFFTHQRRPLFAEFAPARAAAAALSDSRHWRSARLLSWVLMPDHWHALVELGEGASLARLVQDLKADSTRGLQTQHPELGPVWARAFHERALRRDDDTIDAARYLVMNPIRAGLARNIREYPFWDAVWL